MSGYEVGGVLLAVALAAVAGIAAAFMFITCERFEKRLEAW